MAASLYCRKCGTRLAPGGAFCPGCGESLSDMKHLPTNRPSQAPPHLGTGRMPAGHMLRERYRLLQAVGQGGMGAVYVAQDTQLGDRLVAVKEMSMRRLSPQELPLAVEQFKREAHLLASLQHPHLPIIYEYFGVEDRWYLVMSFIEGGTLQAYLDIAQEKKLPLKEVVHIGIELCNVLDYLHTHQPQIIFRDLKPSNVMYTPKGKVYLIDFGIARHFKQDQAKDTSYYYSVGYAPPEQYGQSQTGPRSDIYSLGATLHQMLSGHTPASKPFQFPALQLLDPTIPAPLARLIAQMLEMNEQQRPASVEEVKAQLENVLKTGQVEVIKKVDDGKAEKVLTPDQVEAIKKADDGKKEEARVEKVSVQQNAAMQNEQSAQMGSRLEKSVDAAPKSKSKKPNIFAAEPAPKPHLKKPNFFASHPRISITLVVIVLSICGAGIGAALGSYIGYYSSYSSYTASIGAQFGSNIGLFSTLLVSVIVIVFMKLVDAAPKSSSKKPNFFASHPRISITLVIIVLSICGAVIGGNLGWYIGSYSSYYGSSTLASQGSAIGFVYPILISGVVITFIRRLRRKPVSQ